MDPLRIEVQYVLDEPVLVMEQLFVTLWVLPFARYLKDLVYRVM